ncbi:MAG: exodeoxyribonuclease VII large subunit [Alphaproteobacteria bacterium]
MSDTPTRNPAPNPETGLHNLPVYTVSEISGAVKRTLEGEFAHVRVRGEISGFKRPGSGHLYFSLKDEQAVLNAVCWRGTAAKLGLEPEDGMDVICTGRVTAYPGRSQYQIVVDSIELAGEGALLKLLAERKKKLEAEGLFAPERKKPIPFLPSVIGVITSPTGAVIRDILHRLADRFPRHVLLWPVAVQGEGAAEQVAAAIRGFNAFPATGGVAPRPDVLIVARGGGSLEDLWAFNEEAVVRAAAASEIPLISAVGHETDVTLIDFAADLRAPTPTAAAEMAVPVRSELVETVLGQERRLVGAMGRLVSERRLRVEGLARGLPDPRSVIGTATQLLDDRVARLAQAITHYTERLSDRVGKTAARLRHPQIVIDAYRAALGSEKRALQAASRRLLSEWRLRLDNLGGLLESYSYRAVLTRGFALVRDESGLPVASAAATYGGQNLVIGFHDGDVPAVVTGEGAPDKDEEKAKPKGAKAAPGRKPRKSSNGRQGKLL